MGMKPAFYTGTQAQYAIKQKQLPDLLIMDLGLPDMDSLNLVRQWSHYGDMGVIILSGRVAPQPRLRFRTGCR